MAFRYWADSGPILHASWVPFKIAHFSGSTFVIAPPFFADIYNALLNNEGSRGQPCPNTRVDLGLGRRRNLSPPNNAIMHHESIQYNVYMNETKM